MKLSNLGTMSQKHTTGKIVQRRTNKLIHSFQTVDHIT